jgi:predicted amidophosphoribosyltransferase
MESKTNEDVIKLRNCVSCNALIPLNSKYCNKCGLPLNNITDIQMDKARKRIDELTNSSKT